MDTRTVMKTILKRRYKQMKKMVGIIILMTICMTVVGCNDVTEVRNDFTKPVIVESIDR